MTTPELPNERDIVRDVSARLDAAGIPFMLTGSLAMNYYAEPRMTRDVDIVVEITRDDIERITMAFASDYYLEPAAVAEAVEHATSFNAIHRTKLLWARESHSAFQFRDVRNLLATPHDDSYLAMWVKRLDLTSLLREARG